MGLVSHERVWMRGKNARKVMGLLNTSFVHFIIWLQEHPARMLGTWEVATLEKLVKMRMNSQSLESSTARLGCYLQHALQRATPDIY